MADAAAAGSSSLQRAGIFEKVEEESMGKKQAGDVHQALVWIHKAKAGSVQWVEKCTEEQFNYYCLAKKMKILGTIAKYGLLLCTVFDMPSWCRGTPEACSTYVKQLYSPGFPIMPHRAGAGISLIFWSILAIRMKVRELAMGDAYSFRQWHIFTGVVVTIGGVSAFISLIFPMVYNVSVICRPFAFMGSTKSLRKGCTHIVRSIPGFIDVLIALAICVFVCVWMGMVLFARTSEGYADFWAWRQGFAQMWILFTTNNTPNVIMPAYNANRAYFWFFLSYLLITVFLLGNVLLAKVYDTYKDVLKEDLRQHMENQKVSMTRAFSFLSDSATGVISPSTWREFFVAYCDPNLGTIQVGDPDDVEYNIMRANIILKKSHDVDVDEGSAGINFDQFKKISNVFFNKGIYIASKRPPAAEFRFEALQRLNGFFQDGYETESGRKITWDGTMDCVIGLGTCIVFYETWFFAHRYNSTGVFLDFIDSPGFWVLFVLSLIYVFAITVKINTLGFERFWYKKPVQHRFDLVNVYGLIITELLYIFVFPYVGMMRLIMLLHMARGLRLFWYIEPLQHFFFLMTRLVPVYWQMGMILFIVYWIFCDIGQLWFGGLIYTSNPNLAGTSFASPDFQFFELNFNCFLDGMITLFTLMCMNNWSDTSDGFMQVTQSYMSQAYFVAFTIICNMIVLNILLALILDCTGVVKAECEAQADGPDETGDFEGAAGTDQVDVMARLLGEDEASSEAESSSSSEESGDERNEEIDEKVKKLSVSSQAMLRRKKTTGQLKKKTQSLATVLTKEERKRQEKLVGSPTRKGRKSIG